MGWLRAPIALFLVAALAIGGVATAAIAMRGTIRTSDVALAQAALDLGETERLRSLRERVSRKMRSFLFTRDTRFVEELREAETAFRELLSVLHAGAVVSEERELIGQLEQHERARRVTTDRLIEERTAGASVDVLIDKWEKELQPTLDTLDGTIATLVEYHRRDVERTRAESASVFSRATAVLWIAAGLALLVAALSSAALARTMRRIESHAERRLRRERDRFFELSLDMVCIAGMDGYFKQLNPAFATILGYVNEELLGKPFLDFVHPDDRDATTAVVANLANGQPAVDFENRYRCKDGSYRWLSWHSSPELPGMIYAIARDITERKAADGKLAALADELRQMAVVDELTGLHNRRGLTCWPNSTSNVPRTASRRSCSSSPIWMAGLKAINDKLGHDIGDRAICDAATVLSSAFRTSDIVARLGGDEFVVLCTDGASDNAQTLVDRLETQVRQFNASESHRPFALAISIGSTVYDPEQPEVLDAVLKRADAMMYAQKVRRKSVATAVVAEPTESAK